MRNLGSAVTSAVSENGVYTVDFVEIIVDETDTSMQFRLSNGFKEFTFGGNTYSPASQLLGIGSLDETSDVKTNSISITVAGIDDAIIEALGPEETIGSIVTIYRGYVDDDTGALVATPYNRWKGVLNNYNFEESNERDGTITVTIDCKNIVAALLESTGGRFTSLSSFQQENPSDMSMEFVAGLAEWNPRFGAE